MSLSDSDREDLRATLSAFDERRKKIVGGVIAIMIEHPERVSEREWITEQYTQVTLLACGFDDVASVRDGMQQMQDYVRDHIDDVLNACYRLFQAVADDLAAREGFTREEAVAQALSYFN